LCVARRAGTPALDVDDAVHVLAVRHVVVAGLTGSDRRPQLNLGTVVEGKVGIMGVGGNSLGAGGGDGRSGVVHLPHLPGAGINPLGGLYRGAGLALVPSSGTCWCCRRPY